MEWVELCGALLKSDERKRGKKPRFAVWGGRMNLRVAGGIAGSIRVLGYLTQRRAHHTVLQFT